MVYLLGWHWEFLPSFLGKLVPGVDLVPFWTLAVANVYRKSKRIAVATEESREQRAELRGGTNSNVGPLLDQKSGETKQPFCFEVNEGGLFAFAGLWDRWKDASATAVETQKLFPLETGSLYRAAARRRSLEFVHSKSIHKALTTS